MVKIREDGEGEKQGANMPTISLPRRISLRETPFVEPLRIEVAARGATIWLRISNRGPGGKFTCGAAVRRRHRPRCF